MKRLNLLLLLSLIFFGCSDELDSPIADFEIINELARPGEPIVIINKSKFSSGFSASVNDQDLVVQQSDDMIKIYGFNPGQYSVQLSAYNEAGQVSSINESIRIGKVKLQKVTIEHLDQSIFGTEGSVDIFWNMQLLDGSTHTSDFLAGVGSVDLPISWDVIDSEVLLDYQDLLQTPFTIQDKNSNVNDIIDSTIRSGNSLPRDENNIENTQFQSRSGKIIAIDNGISKVIMDYVLIDP